MKYGKFAFATLMVLAISLASAQLDLRPSVAVRGGFANGALFGIEASWKCQLFQPPVGTLRPALDLGLGGTSFDGAFSMRYLIDAPGSEGLRVGGGAGIGYRAGGAYGLLRLDAEFDLGLEGLPAPLFVGVDGGYAFGFQQNAFTGPFGALKLGLRF